jgi:hypothetical protein
MMGAYKDTSPSSSQWERRMPRVVHGNVKAWGRLARVIEIQQDGMVVQIGRDSGFVPVYYLEEVAHDRKTA